MPGKFSWLWVATDSPWQRSAPRRASTSYEAYDLYLRGRYFWNKRTADGFEQAIDYFQQAIAKDPGYAQAYAGLADCYVLMAAYSGVPPAEFVQQARAAAQKALQLDEGIAEAHTSLALITENYDWDWPLAEKEYRRAIELNPNYATAYQWYAEYLTWLGRFDEAARESERARELDPLSLIIAADNGMIFYYSRQYDRAHTKLDAVLEMDPNFSRGHMVRYAYVEKGQFAEALADVEKCRTQFGIVAYWSSMAYTLGRAGRAAEAQHALGELDGLNRTQPVSPDAFSWAYAGMGDKDKALFWLNRAYAQRSNAMTVLKVEPAYDFLRGDPRFQDLIHRVGLDKAESPGLNLSSAGNVTEVTFAAICIATGPVLLDKMEFPRDCRIPWHRLCRTHHRRKIHSSPVAGRN